MTLGRSSNRTAVLVTCILGFILVGAEQALYGPSFEAFQRRFGLGAAEVSLVLSMHFLGSFVTILGSGLLIRFMGYRALLVASSLVLAAGVAGVGTGGSWPLVLTGALAAGLGFGALDAGVNLLAVRSFQDRLGPTLNILNAMFGLGAILAPVLVAAFVPGLAGAYLAVAAFALVVAALSLRIEAPAPQAAPAVPGGVSFVRAAGFVVLYFFYVSSEVGGAAWEATHLTPHFGAVRAATFTSFYWLAITVGRLLAAPLSARIAPGKMVVGAAALATVAAALASITPLAPFAYALMGLAFAPIFPGILAWISRAFPERAEQVAPLALAGANLGPVATAPVIGALVTAGGPSVVPLALAALIVLVLVTAGVLLAADRTPRTERA